MNESSAEACGLSTGCKSIDSMGYPHFSGFPVHGINEIFGPAGSGKTQLSLQVSLVFLNNDESNRAAYVVCGNKKFPIQRLMQMRHMKPQLNSPTAGERLLIKCIPNATALEMFILETLPAVKLQHPTLKLLIIDSITDCFRGEFTSAENIERSKILVSIGKGLKHLTTSYGIRILVVNQASSWDGETTAALGIQWSNMVSFRAMVSASHGNQDPPWKACSFAVQFGTVPKCPFATTFFITSNGVDDEPPSEKSL